MLRVAVEGHALTIVDEVVVAVADIGGGTAGDIVNNEKKGGFIEDAAVDQILALSRHKGHINALGVGQHYLRSMVIGYRICKRRELSRLGSGIEGIIVEATTGDRIDLEKRVFDIITPWDQSYWCSVARGALPENFSGAL